MNQLPLPKVELKKLATGDALFLFGLDGQVVVSPADVQMVESIVYSVNTLPQVEEQLAKAKELLKKVDKMFKYDLENCGSSECCLTLAEFLDGIRTPVEKFLKENQ